MIVGKVLVICQAYFRKADATMRRPGARIAPTAKVIALAKVGAVKAIAKCEDSCTMSGGRIGIVSPVIAVCLSTIPYYRLLCCPTPYSIGQSPVYYSR